MIRPPSLDLAVIGNSHVAALVDKEATIMWGCWPNIQGDAIFCALLDGASPQSGFFSINFADGAAKSEQTYVRNTAIVQTTLTDAAGASFRVTDFCPRFRQHGRMFRPSMIIRRIEPLSGLCRIRVCLRPRTRYGAEKPRAVPGSNHIRYISEENSVRLTTDAPVSYILNETAFVLNQPVTLILHIDEQFEQVLPRVAREFEDQTRDYWLEWVRNLNLPFDWQDAVIRSAITLQLCSFHETGAIVAALTTSIPEDPGSGRNWDYRFCWIRDAFFTVHALNRVGATHTMERFIDYVTNVIAFERSPNLKPVYGIIPDASLEERVATTLAGYRGHGPVRVGNAAVDQVQHDVYGSVILAASQMFFDERLPSKGDAALFELLEPLGEQALMSALKPDAGIWEYRLRARIHTHSAAMCWVACDRLARISARLGRVNRSAYWRKAADSLKGPILDRAWSRKLGSFAGSLDTDELDASVLLLHELGIIAPADERFVATVDVIGKRLMRGGHLMRYAAPDDFGAPSVAFTICTFWYVDALAAVGRTEEARAIFEVLLSHRNHVGLLSEDIDPATGELWGNFPQTYSMVGIIVAAMRLSKGWEHAR